MGCIFQLGRRGLASAFRACEFSAIWFLASRTFAFWRARFYAGGAAGLEITFGTAEGAGLAGAMF